MALKIDIKGQVSDLKAKVGQARASLKSFAASAKANFLKVGAAIAGAFAITRIVSMARSLVDEMDQIGKASKGIGVTAETFQEMAFAAKLAGVPMEKLKLSMGALAAFMLQAANKGRIQTAVLKRLGLEYKALSQMKPEDQFKAITKSLDGVANATERVGLARSLFGRSGMDLLLVAREYDEAVKKIRSGGGIITAEDIKAAEKFNDQLALMEKRLKARATKSGLLAWLNDIAKTIGDKGLFDFSRPLSKGLLTGEGLGGTSEEAVAAAHGEKISKKMVEGAKKTLEEAKLGKDIADVFDAEKAGAGAGRKDRFRVDELRRIGAAGLGPGGMGGPDPVTDAVAYWLPLVLSAAKDINRKTPEINDGGRY